MRKTLFISLLALVTTGSFGQKLIPRAGVTISNATLDASQNLGEVQSVTGFTVGVGYEISLGGKFWLQPEINFIQKGYEMNYNETSIAYEQTTTRTLKLNYLEIPVLLKVKFGGTTKFYFTTGPSIGYALSGKFKEKNTVDYFDSTPTATYEREDDVKFEAVDPIIEDYGLEYIPHRIDFGIQFGGGVELFGKVMIDIRYSLGLTQLYGDEEHLNIDLDQVKNRVIQFSVGVPLSLK